MKVEKVTLPVVAAVLGEAAFAYHGQRPDLIVDASAAPLSSPTQGASAAVGLPDFTDLVASAAPAVVNISVTRAVPAARAQGPG